MVQREQELAHIIVIVMFCIVKSSTVIYGVIETFYTIQQ